MVALTQGGNTKLDGAQATVTITAGKSGLDVAALGIMADGKIYKPTPDDFYLSFYSQIAASGDGALHLNLAKNGFGLDLAKLPTAVEKVVFAISVEEGSTDKIASFGSVKLKVDPVDTAIDQIDFTAIATGNETSLIMGEIYKRNGEWKVKAIGQGFNDGFGALLRSYGVETEAEPATPVPAPVAPAAPAPKVNLHKVRLEKAAEAAAKTGRVSLVKDAEIFAKTLKVSLEKVGLTETDLPSMDVVLVMDTSGSMRPHYNNKSVQAVTERVLSAAMVLDDDGRVPVIGFDRNAQNFGEVTAENHHGFISRTLGRNLGTATYYGKAIDEVNAIPSETPSSVIVTSAGSIECNQRPRLVVFVTDGDASDPEVARRKIKQSAMSRDFYLFVGVGREEKKLLQELDDMKDRYIDNADLLEKPTLQVSAEELYKDMTKELGKWVKQATELGLLHHDPKAAAQDPKVIATVQARFLAVPGLASAPGRPGTPTPPPSRGWNPFN